MKYNARGSRQDIEALRPGMKGWWKLWNAVTLRLCSWVLRCSLLMPAILMASVIATGRWHITVWYFSPFTLEKKEAFRLEVAGSREQKCNAGEKVTDLHEGDSRYLTFRSSHMQQTPREPVRSFFFFTWVGVGMSSLRPVTYRGNVSSKRACVWDLEILLWSGMLVVKTTGCKGIWPSLGYRSIIGWFHTKVNCSNVKSGKTGTFRNKTLGRGEILFFFLFVVGATWFFSLKV